MAKTRLGLIGAPGRPYAAFTAKEAVQPSNPAPSPGTKIVRQVQRPATIGHAVARPAKLMRTERIAKIVK